MGRIRSLGRAAALGATKHSSDSTTIRNQNAAEVTAGLNGVGRTMKSDLTDSVDLGQSNDTFVTFLVRENTGSLSASQLASSNRTLSLAFQNSSGSSLFDFAIRGSQQQFAIDSVADTTGESVTSPGFTPNSVYLFVGKFSGNGAAANTMQASLFSVGSLVADFTDPAFQWMLTAHSSDSFNPVITGLQFSTAAESNFTVSNVWIGNAATMIPPTLTSQGDFNQDGVVNSADYIAWRNADGQTGTNLAADANGDNVVNDADLTMWRAHFGMSVTAGGAALGSSAVPEPASLAIAAFGALLTWQSVRRR